ncbi:MAG: 2-oxoacid:acceptor oxidoreductase family protein [Caldisericia bacterium]|nr:2-oxoacid:acceptor oxidoreductase family protein [Caldisericia bacterium]
MNFELCASGFGGQGVMAIGQLLSYAAVRENKFTLFLPSYGPEMRGGTANCVCMVSDKEIGSPVTQTHKNAIVMNTPSFTKFEPTIIKGGNLLVNSALINDKSNRKDINVFYVPANHIAKEAGHQVAANIVMLGALLKIENVAKYETIEQVIKEKFVAKGQKVIDINFRALKMGYDSV